MKKKWLAVGLAAIMGCGCLFACEEGETENNNGTATLDGEVTEEQWVSAFEDLDTTNYIINVASDGHDDSHSENMSMNLVLNENKVKYYINYHWENETSNWRSERTRYATKVDGTVYVYDKTLDDTYAWVLDESNSFAVYFEDFSLLKNLVKGDEDEDLQGLKTLSQIVESAKDGMSEYTYDSTKKVYYMVSDEKEFNVETTYTVMLEVEFSDGEVFLRQILNFFGGREGYMQECWSFEKETLELPAQDELNEFINNRNDVINNRNTLLGLYKFSKMIYGEASIGVGDEIDGVELTEDYFVVGLKEFGEAIISINGGVMKGTWSEGDGNAVIVTLPGSNQIVCIKDGDALMCTWTILENEEELTYKLTKKSDSVNPDDFVVKEPSSVETAGLYRLVGRIIDDVEYKIGDTIYEGQGPAESVLESFDMELFADGTATWNDFLGFTWTEDDNAVYLDNDEFEQCWLLYKENGKLYGELTDGYLVFEKVTE